MIRDLRINYGKNSLGIDDNPRFSWKLESGRQNVVQKGYQIQVASQGTLIWDSGYVESDQSVFVPYGGGVLRPATSYQVQVSVWDNYGELGQEQTEFETGLMREENWQAKWITHELPGKETACPVFRKEFSLKKNVRAARLYATACGTYEACINGQKAGDAFFTPSRHFGTRGWRITFGLTALLISVSTVFLKQHSVLDVVAAVPICMVAYYLVYKRKKHRASEAYSKGVPC